MMGTTHILAGMALAAVYSGFAEPGILILMFSIAGSIFPDLDMPLEHRKTFHWPEHFLIAALLAGIAGMVYPNIYLQIVFLFFLNAAFHCLMDVLSCGLEPYPWQATDERAVYSHIRDEWIRPRRWISYDGSIGDLLLGLVIAVPLLQIYRGDSQYIIAGIVFTSILYTASRKHLERLAPEKVSEKL